MAKGFQSLRALTGANLPKQSDSSAFALPRNTLWNRQLIANIKASLQGRGLPIAEDKKQTSMRAFEVTVFSASDIFERRARRIAELLKDHWEEKSGFDTRFFEPPFIHDHMVLRGRSSRGCGYREHIVPRIVIRDGCLSMLDAGASINDLQNAIAKYLGILDITREEARHLDFDLKLKTVMPPGWCFGVDDPFARIREAKIDIIQVV